MDDHKANTMSRAGFKLMLRRKGKPIKSDSDHHCEYGEKMHPVDDDEAQLEYFVLPAVFREEICKVFNPKTVEHLLVERRMLLPAGAGERKRADRKNIYPGWVTSAATDLGKDFSVLSERSPRFRYEKLSEYSEIGTAINPLC